MQHIANMHNHGLRATKTAQHIDILVYTTKGPTFSFASEVSHNRCMIDKTHFYDIFATLTLHLCDNVGEEENLNGRIYKAYFFIFRYNVLLSIPRIFAAFALFPPVTRRAS
jgi:hypothetical protein